MKEEKKAKRPQALKLCEKIGAYYIPSDQVMSENIGDYFSGTAPVQSPGATGSHAGWPAINGAPVTGAPGGDFQTRQLADLQKIRAGLSPDAQKKFAYDVYIYNTMRGNVAGDIDQVLQQMHPWLLQKLVQKYQFHSGAATQDAPAP